MATPPKPSPFSDEELKHIAKAKILQKLALRLHLLAYVGVNLLLFVINYLTSGLTLIWFVYPAAGWFIGIVAHGTAYALYTRGTSNGAKIGLVLDAATYLAATPALAVINYFSSFEYMWFLWPALFWLLGIVIQAIVLKMTAPKPAGYVKKKSWLESGVDKEMAKLKANEQR